MKLFNVVLFTLVCQSAFSSEANLPQVTNLLKNHCEATSCNQNLDVSFNNFNCDFKRLKQCQLKFTIATETAVSNASCNFFHYSKLNQIVEVDQLTERFLEEAVDCIGTKINSVQEME